jgi:Tol biopolymer transport system component/serine/threonine protein kinase
MIGRTLSHYRVLEELSRGGMGIVYRALDLKLDREVALKVLPPELVADPERKRRFVQEAKAAAKLNHPHIGTVYEIDEAEGVTFIAMELIEGEKLRDVLLQERLPIARSLELATEIAEGLVRAHDKGIAHRDLKPANIMVSEDGHAKIIDFGLAKLVEPLELEGSDIETLTRQETEPGKVMGTVAYMSPEQARGQKVDQRSDIFSFGIVLYEMLAGEPPFKAPSSAELLNAIINASAESLPLSDAGDTSHDLQRVLDKCLTKEPAERYQTVKDLVVDLKAVRRWLESGSVTPVAASVRGGSWLYAVAGAATVLVLLGLVLMLAPLPWRVEPSPKVPRIDRTIQLTRDPEPELDPAISPDGKMIAYAAGPYGQQDIYVQQVSGGRPICLTKEFPGNHRWPQWSPDGTRIVFGSVKGAEAENYIVPTFGGIPRRLTGPSPGETGSGFVWSPDGEQLAYTQDNGIYIRSVDDGVSIKITEASEAFPLSWSPDGTKIAYSKGNSQYIIGSVLANIAPSSLWTVPVPDGDPVRVTENAYLDHNPVWTPDGKHLLFVSDRGGARDIYQIHLDASGAPSGSPARLTTGLNVHTISLSSDGTRLAYSVLTKTQNIWSIEIPKDDPISDTGVRPVTMGNQAIEGIDVSPDGLWLVFDSNRSGNQDIYKMPIEGGEPQQLTTDPADDFLPTWSPDGKEIVFYSFRTGNRDLFVMSDDGRSIRQLTNHPAQDRYPDWSPDGKEVVFYSDRSGRQELYVIAKDRGEPEGEEPRQITTAGGRYPRWSPDGRLIAFNTPLQGLSVVSVDGEGARLLAPQGTGTRVFPAWSEDSGTIYYKARGPGNRSSFWSVPAAGGEPKLLVEFDNPSRKPVRHEFTTDGERFFFTLTEYESDVWMMELAAESR